MQRDIATFTDMTGQDVFISAASVYEKLAAQRNGTTAGSNDKTGAYLSPIDEALLASFTQVTGEVVERMQRRRTRPTSHLTR